MTKAEADAAHFDFVVCRRIAPPFEHITGSHEEQCSKCQHPIWVAPTSPPKPPRVCDFCMADLPNAEGDDEEHVVTALRQSWAETMTARIMALRYWQRKK